MQIQLRTETKQGITTNATKYIRSQWIHTFSQTELQKVGTVCEYRRVTPRSAVPDIITASKEGILAVRAVCASG